MLEVAQPRNPCSLGFPCSFGPNLEKLFLNNKTKGDRSTFGVLVSSDRSKGNDNDSFTPLVTDPFVPQRPPPAEPAPRILRVAVSGRSQEQNPTPDVWDCQ